jgi:hypothetical protein
MPAVRGPSHLQSARGPDAPKQMETTMRTKLLTLFALTALVAVPAAAEAREYAGRRGHRDHGDRWGWQRPAPRAGFITVDNPNAKPLEVLVDRQVVGQVDPGGTARFGPFDAGDHRVRVRFVSRRGDLRFPVVRQRVSVHPRYPARIFVPPVETALVKVRNEWIEPMELRIDGQTMGMVPAGGKLRVPAPTGARVALVAPDGTRALRARVRATALETERLRLTPPAMATVSVHNPLRGELQLLDATTGELLCVLRPGASDLVTLPSGFADLQVRFRNRIIDATSILANPWATNAWTVTPPATAPLRLRNHNRVDLHVSVNGQHLGTVAAGDRQRLMGLPVGHTTVTVSGPRGRRQQTYTVFVDPLYGAKLVPDFPIGDGRGNRYGHHDRGYDRHSRGYDRTQRSAPPAAAPTPAPVAEAPTRRGRGRGNRGYSSSR